MIQEAPVITGFHAHVYYDAGEKQQAAKLREAVEAVLREQPPPDWAKETLEGLRRRSPRTAPRKSLLFVTWIALATAACIVVIALPDRPRVVDDGQEVVKERSKPPVEAPAPMQSESARPTLWVYRQAAGQSPETLDELLDRHGWLRLRLGPHVLRAETAAVVGGAMLVARGEGV